MKTSLFIFLSAFCMAAQGKSKQDSTSIAKISSVGIYSGFNFTYSPIHTLNSQSYDFGSPVQLGVNVNFNVNESLQFELGLALLEYGSKYLKFTYLDNSNTRLDTILYHNEIITGAVYLSLPIIIKYRITDRHSIIGGVTVSQLLGNDISTVMSYKTSTAHLDIYDKSDNPILVNTTEIDAGFLLGYEYHFNDRLLASFAYHIGLVPLVTNNSIKPLSAQPEFSYSISDGNYNNSLNIRVCYNLFRWGDEEFDIKRTRHHWHPLRFPQK